MNRILATGWQVAARCSIPAIWLTLGAAIAAAATLLPNRHHEPPPWLHDGDSFQAMARQWLTSDADWARSIVTDKQGELDRALSPLFTKLLDAAALPSITSGRSGVPLYAVMNFTCPACRNVFEAVLQWAERHDVALRLLIIPETGDPASIAAANAMAEAIRSGAGEGRRLARALFASDDIAGTIAAFRPVLGQYAQPADVHRHASDLATALMLPGTPGFVLGDRVIRGADLDALVAIRPPTE